jgi:hypothetical protein
MVDYSVSPNVTSCLTLVLEGIPKVSDIENQEKNIPQENLQKNKILNK